MASEAGAREGAAIQGGGAAVPSASARLVGWDTDAVEKLAAALLYRYSGTGYDEVLQTVRAMPEAERHDIIHRCVEGIGPHDLPGREFETVHYTFEFTLDYGAFREFRRHRMLTCLPQPATVALGYRLPPLIHDAGMASVFESALGRAEQTFRRVQEVSPTAAQYLVTHAHYRHALAHVNLRECYHLFKLRTSELAHDAIREPVSQAMRLAVDTHPELSGTCACGTTRSGGLFPTGSDVGEGRWEGDREGWLARVEWVAGIADGSLPPQGRRGGRE